MEEYVPGMTPEDMARTDLLSQPESLRALRGVESLLAQGRTWHDILARLETEKEGDIPWVARVAVNEILWTQETRHLELRRGDDRPHAWLYRELETTLLTKQSVLKQQLGGEESWIAKAGGKNFPDRAEIPVLDEFKRPIIRRYWNLTPMVTEDGRPLYKTKPDGSLVMDKAGQPIQRVWEERVEFPQMDPVSDEQLGATIKALGDSVRKIDALEWYLNDSAIEQGFSADLEEQVRKGFGASWKNEPYPKVLAVIFRAPELVPGLVKESAMIQAGIESFLTVGSEGKIGYGKGIKDIFAHPYTDEDYEDALRYATAKIMDSMGALKGGIIARIEGEEAYLHALGVAHQVPRFEDAQDDSAYLYAQAIAQRSLSLFKYLWLDVNFGTWKKGKLKTSDKRCAQAGILPGVPEWGIEVGKLTGRDPLKMAEAGVRILSESKAEFPFRAGAGRAIVAAIPRLTMDDLRLSNAIWVNNKGKEYRLSFRRLVEMGVSLADLPWTETCCPGLKEKFIRAYGLTSKEVEAFEDDPAGMRADGLHVPVGLQRFYAGGQWLDLTEADVDQFCAKMKNAAALYGENKDIYLMFAIMSGDLLIDDKDFIIKFCQYYKVHKLGAAFIMMTKGGEGTFEAALARREIMVDFGESALLKVEGGILDMARSQALYLSGKEALRFKVPRGERDKKGSEIVTELDAAWLEDNLFYKVIGKTEDNTKKELVKNFIDQRKERFRQEGVELKDKELDRGGVSPKDSGWFTDKELVEWVAFLYPQGVGFTQEEIKSLLLNGTVKTVEQLDALGWTGELTRDEQEKLKAQKRFSEDDLKRIQALAIKD